MKKHGSGFNGKTPEAYFNQSHQQGQTTLQHHQQWLDNIRQCIWDRIEFENEMIPNTDALYRHWTRVCWVLDMWSQADRNTMAPKPVSEYGWKIIEGTLAFDWDSDSNMDAIRERVAGLLKGCGCKTGCQTRQCGCKGKGKACGEGCNCTNCTNTDCCTTSAATNGTEDASIKEIVTDALPEDLDEIMEWVFGEYEAEAGCEEGSDNE